MARHLTIADHAASTPVRFTDPAAGRPFSARAVLDTPVSVPASRDVALAVAWATRGKPVAERRELLKMMGVTQ